MENIKRIIRSDLVTLNSGSNKMKWAYIALLVFLQLFGLTISPLLSGYSSIFVAMMSVTMLFGKEVKNHGEKMYCLLPVKRSDIVKARFITVMSLNIITTVIAFFSMLLSLKLELYLKLVGEDIISLMMKRTPDMNISRFRICLIAFLLFSGAALITAASMLRTYFKNPNLLGADFGKSEKMSKRDAVGVTVIIVILLLIFANISGVIPLGAALVIVVQLLSQLASAGGGVLLAAVLLVITLLEIAFQFICTLIEYGDKEL